MNNIVNIYLEKQDGSRSQEVANDLLNNFTGFTLTKNGKRLNLIEDVYAGSRIIHINEGDRLVIELN